MLRSFADKLPQVLKWLKDRFWGRYAVASASLFVIVIIALAGSGGPRKPPVPQHDLLEAIPAPEHGAPFAVITALRDEFPYGLARLMTNGAAAPDKIHAAAFMPVFGSAGATALVVTETEGGLSVYGAFVPALEEYDTLRSGELPDEWKKRLGAASLRNTDRINLYQLVIGDGANVYLLAEDGIVYAADSVAGINRVMDVRNGVAGGIKRKWSVNPELGGHAYLSDGGLISAMTRGAGMRPNPKESIELEVAWVTPGDASAIHAKWQVFGMEHVAARTFLNELKPHDWAKDEIFAPDPLVLSFGLNLPNPGRSTANYPAPLMYAADHLRKLGLRSADVRAILTGPAAFSLGGRTQLLWFDLPGVAIDMPERGDAGYRLIDKFWQEAFAGSEPEPVAGYAHGGITNLPFTVLAVANEKHALLGLVPRDSDQNYEARELLSVAAPSIGWVYADFPRLGASLLEIPALNSMMYEEDEENPLDEESAGKLNNALSSLGRVFITWDSAVCGGAVCYY